MQRLEQLLGKDLAGWRLSMGFFLALEGKTGPILCVDGYEMIITESKEALEDIRKNLHIKEGRFLSEMDIIEIPILSNLSSCFILEKWEKETLEKRLFSKTELDALSHKSGSFNWSIRPHFKW